MSAERRLIVFRSRLRAGVEADYGPRAEAMYALAQSMPGFVSAQDYASEDGERVAIIEFETRETLKNWATHPEHVTAQTEGRERWYDSYALTICQVLRESRFDRKTGVARAPEIPAPSDDVALSGGCACGAVRYAVRGKPFNETLCHCTDCRKASGATPVAWATFITADFEITNGALRERASSERARRGFCPECGAQVTFRYLKYPDLVDIALATLDEPSKVTPRDHTFVQSKPEWTKIGDDLPRFSRERPTE